MAISELPARVEEESIGAKLPACFTPEMRRYFGDMISGSFQPFTAEEIQAIVDHYVPLNPLIPLSSEKNIHSKTCITKGVSTGFDREYIWKGLAGDVMYFPPNHAYHPFARTACKDRHLFVDVSYLQQLGIKHRPPVLLPQEKEALFTDPRVWEHADVSFGFPPTNPMMHPHTRDVFSDRIYSYRYNRSEFHRILQTIRKRQGKSERGSLSGLDIGGSTGYPAYLMETEDQNLSVTNLTYDPEPAMWQLRGGHRIGMAEQMPGDWRERFDLVISNCAFMHMEQPALAILNALQALSVHGILALHIGGSVGRKKQFSMAKVLALIEYLSQQGFTATLSKDLLLTSMLLDSDIHLTKNGSIPQGLTEAVAANL